MSGRRAAPTDHVDDAAVRAMLGAERLDLCAWLGQLGPGEWSTPSRCAGWTVQEVVAHLTLSTRETAVGFVTGMLRHRGDFDRMNAARARAWAGRWTTAELVEQLRDSAGSSATSFGSSPRDALVDVIVHGHGARKRLAHATLEASDATWAAGAGASTIVGPAIDLLLVAAGRPGGLERLTGSGVEEVRRRLAA
jgi:hypothetical protein